jgi:hypothetical protein
MENRTLRDVGGTPGGLGEFIIGFVMACVGGYLLSNQVSIVGSYWSFYGANTFGVTLILMLLASQEIAARITSTNAARKSRFSCFSGAAISAETSDKVSRTNLYPQLRQERALSEDSDSQCGQSIFGGARLLMNAEPEPNFLACFAGTSSHRKQPAG